MLHLLLVTLTLTSPDVRNGAPIPHPFVWSQDGCDGDNRTPRLLWNDSPRGTRAFAVTVVDPDAPKPGGWVHWLVMNIPASSRALSQFEPHTAIAGRNDFGTLGWGGPCPPPGPPHHYVFTLDALDIAPPFSTATTYDAYKKSVRGHVLASAKIVPVYGR